MPLCAVALYLATWFVLGIILPIAVDFDFQATVKHPVFGNPFILAIVGSFLPFVLVCHRFLHKRRTLSLFSGASKIDVRKFFKSASVFLALSVVTELVLFAFMPRSYVVSCNPDLFWKLSLVMIPLILIQVTAEEVFFRGYLLQGFSLLARRPWVGIVVTSALFFSLHLSNPEVAAYGIPFSAIIYGGTGLLLGCMTIFEEGIESAVGMHFSNNLYCFLVVDYPHSVGQGSSALFTVAGYNPVLIMVQFLAISATYVFVMTRRRKFRVGDLFGGIPRRFPGDAMPATADIADPVCKESPNVDEVLGGTTFVRDDPT